MKIFAIGRNYAEHIEELNNERTEEPVVFSKPDTAILTGNEPFFYPSISNDIHYEIEVLIKISRTGKNIEEKFAHKYYDKLGLGIDFTARDLQNKAKIKGLPWDLAKGFNGSAPISTFISKKKYDLNNINFSLSIDGKEVQKGNTSRMLYGFDYIISYLSRFFTLKIGDIIFTGTPKGVGPVQINNHLDGYFNGEKLLSFSVK